MAPISHSASEFANVWEPSVLVPVTLVAATPPVEIAKQTPRSYVRGEVTNVWNLPFDRLTMNEAVQAIGEMIAERTPRYVVTANLNYAMLAAEDPQLGPVTANASLILADGQPIVWRSLLSGQSALPCRVTGSELVYRLASKASQMGWRIYFLGAEPGVAAACADILVARYPGLQVAGVHSPPYRKLTAEEIKGQQDQIRAARPDILLVALGQPKGEKWVHENYQALGVPVSIQVGASFDFVAGRAKRAPKIWQRLGLEWAHRMAADPLRLAPRYYRNAQFLAISLIQDWAAFVRSRYSAEPATARSLHQS